MPVPVGELSTVGVGKESAFGTIATPTLFHAIEALTPSTKNVFNERVGSRGAPSMPYPATGPFEVGFTARMEGQANVVEQLIAYGFGTQSTPQNYGSGITTQSVASGSGKSVTLTMYSGTINVGTFVLFDYGNYGAAEVVVAGTGSTNAGLVATTFGFTHSNGAAVDICYAYGTIAAVTASGSSQSIAYTATGGTLQAGQLVAVDYGGSNYELVTALAGTNSTTLVGVFTKSHGSGSAKCASLSTAYSSTYSFGKILTLPSFTVERNYGTVGSGNFTESYLGSTVDQMKFAVDVAKNLQLDLTCVAQWLQQQASPTTPTLGQKFPYAMEAAGTATTLNGVSIGSIGNPPYVLKYDVTLNNQLNKSRRSAGAGRKVVDFPLGLRKITGSLMLGFDNTTAMQLFWGGSTSPGTIVKGIPLVFTIASQDYADTINSIPYSIVLTMPNCAFLLGNVAHNTNGPLDQAVSFTAYDSVPGAGDALNAVITNNNTTAY
jgi:hypothetical protein